MIEFISIFLKRNRLLVSACFLVTIPGIAGCSSFPATPELEEVTVQLSWVHQAEFAGLYAADQLGYFAEEGIDVTFVEGGQEVDSIAPVASGSVQFGIAQPANLLLARSSGSDVRSIAVIYRRSPIVFFALADSGIVRPQDFVGKKIRSALTIDQTLRAMMTKVGIGPELYETVYLPSNVDEFASGEVPVWSGFINVFALEVQRAGYEINIIYPDDYGIHFYGDVLFTHDALIESNPDLVLRFTRAALRGWTYVVENPDAVGAFVQRYNPNADPELEVDRMIASIPIVNTGEDFIGWMRPEIWQMMEKTLREQDVLTDPLTVEQVYTMQFLEEIYRR